jgi:hypothetical protein
MIWPVSGDRYPAFLAVPAALTWLPGPAVAVRLFCGGDDGWGIRKR